MKTATCRTTYSIYRLEGTETLLVYTYTYGISEEHKRTSVEREGKSMKEIPLFIQDLCNFGIHISFGFR